MDFSAILESRQAKAQAAAPSKPGRKASGSAKRNSGEGWRACTFYLREETRARLQKAVMALRFAGLEGPEGIKDQSDLIEAALQEYLPKVEGIAMSALREKVAAMDADPAVVITTERKRRPRAINPPG